MLGLRDVPKAEALRVNPTALRHEPRQQQEAGFAPAKLTTI